MNFVGSRAYNLYFDFLDLDRLGDTTEILFYGVYASHRQKWRIPFHFVLLDSS